MLRIQLQNYTIVKVYFTYSRKWNSTFSRFNLGARM